MRDVTTRRPDKGQARRQAFVPVSSTPTAFVIATDWPGVNLKPRAIGSNELLALNLIQSCGIQSASSRNFVPDVGLLLAVI